MMIFPFICIQLDCLLLLIMSLVHFYVYNVCLNPSFQILSAYHHVRVNLRFYKRSLTEILGDASMAQINLSV